MDFFFSHGKKPVKILCSDCYIVQNVTVVDFWCRIPDYT